MKIPLSWLREYIEINHPPSQIAKILTMAGLEVDAIEKATPPCQGAVVAKVIECQDHPESAHLKVATVSDGQQTHQIVCGAPNCQAGIKTAFAPVGACLIDNQGGTLQVKKTKIRGIDSSGMLCSPRELGISKDHAGIIEFAEHMKEGTDIGELYADTVFEISLTPNLGHCASMIGVARELSAATGLPYKLPAIRIKETCLPTALVEVDIFNSEACPRYACRVICNVSVGPSPDWLKTRLEAAGIRSINNIVDATNYVMLELGQPLHAFDVDLLQGRQIVVKNARKGETFITLDGKQRLLEDNDLIICDQAKPIALAGLMGGINSEVSENTKNIVIEAACFSPKTIRRTSKRLGLMTDASKRFERGTDPNGLIQALDRVAMLIKESANGEICADLVDIATQEFPRKRIDCRLSHLNKILGTQFSVGELESIFNRLEFICMWDGSDTFLVEVPTYRNDVSNEVDLIEEAARIYGFDNISKASTSFQSSKIPHAPMFLFEREMRERLMQEGLQEFLTCDLIGPTLLNIVHGTEMPEKSWVRVLNPTSIEQAILRTSLLPGLLQVVKYNWDHQVQEIAGFEIGRVHFKDDSQYREQSIAAIVLSGKSRPHHWGEKPQNTDFFDLKGIVENLLTELKIPKVAFKSADLSTLHPGRQAAIFSGELKVGSLGEVHPSIVRRLDVPQSILFAELSLHDLLQVRSQDFKMRAIPVYPGSERDWTLTLPEQIPINNVFHAIHSASSQFLESFSLLDVYRSDKVGKGMKNVTFRFFYRDREKTMGQEQVDKEHAHIVESVSKVIF